MLQDGFYDRAKPLTIRYGALPHWRQDGALYFVTFRLADSLPAVKLRQMKLERERLRKIREAGADAEVIAAEALEQRRRIERWLDRGYGSCVLRDRAAGRIVSGAFRHFDGKRYELGRFAIAPNHAHVVVRTAVGVDLSDVLYSWKRFTGTELRKVESVRRAFIGKRHIWQVESFDHIVRNQRQLDRIDGYIARHNSRDSEPAGHPSGRDVVRERSRVHWWQIGKP